MTRPYTHPPNPHSDDCFDRIFALLPKRLKDPIPDLRPLLLQQQQRAHERARAATAGEEDGDGVGSGGRKKAVSFGPDVVAGSDEQHRASVGVGGRRTNKKVTPLWVGNGVEGGGKGEVRFRSLVCG